jgi:hypothetical protein
MKKTIALFLAILGGYFLYTQFGIQEKLTGMFDLNVTISDLKNQPSIYADSLVILKNIRVIENQSVVNYSKSTITDKTGHEIMLLSGRPYRSGEVVKTLKGRYTVLYEDSERNYDFFITEDLTLLDDFPKVLKILPLFR